MRYFEIQGGFRMPIDREEFDLLEAADATELADESLDERAQEVARKMVSKGLFNRLQRDGKLYYTPNGLPNAWRF
jgi:hypothetical protein